VLRERPSKSVYKPVVSYPVPNQSTKSQVAGLWTSEKTRTFRPGFGGSARQWIHSVFERSGDRFA